MIRHLNTLSAPSYYDHAPVGTRLPFIAIHTSQPQGFRADNVNYQRRWEFRIDLYEVEKDMDNEAEIETLLDSLGIPWSQSEQYLDGQSCWEIEYEFDVLGLPDEPAPEPDPEDEEDG
jgi:hypothetical protein